MLLSYVAIFLLPGEGRHGMAFALAKKRFHVLEITYES